MPAGDVHVRARAGERLGDPRQRLRAVDQHLQRIARARRRVAGGPQRAVVWRCELVKAPGALQAQTVVCVHAALERAAGQPVQPRDWFEVHAGETTRRYDVTLAPRDRGAPARVEVA